MAKSPVILQLNRVKDLASLEDAQEIIQSLTDALDEAYRMIRGDITQIETRLDDGGL